MKLFLFLGFMAFNLSHLLERYLVYFPDRHLASNPSQVGLAYEEIFFEAPAARKLHGWWIPHPKAKATLLFFHGNAGNISHRLEKLKILNEVGFATFIFDYAGFGKSEGSPSEKILYEDGRVAYEYLTKNLKIDPKKLIVYGESLGCAVAIELATQKMVQGLICEAAFTSLKEMAKAHYPLLAPLTSDQFNNLKKIEKIKALKLFIHSKQDEIAPFNQMQKLYEAAPPPKTDLWFESGGHNDAFLIHVEDYKKALREIMK